jgi:hypothetical protein
MSETQKSIAEFVHYSQLLKGDENGDAPVFCDRLFKAFGHQGYKEAGATLEFRLKKDKTTKYADLIWKPRLLIEMKTKGEDLSEHYKQAFDSWVQSVPHRPRYVVLCNFDEFWIYDFDLQLDEPVDQLKTADLIERYSALNFLFPQPKKPIFKNDLIAVTRSAADKVATAFNLLIKRGEDRDKSQRFILQCVMALFSEDFGLLPKDLFTELLIDCKGGASTCDLLGALFTQMNSPTAAIAGRYKDVRYFDGGLFADVASIELRRSELELLLEASKENWSKVKPPIFGTLFQSSMRKKARHAFGAHFTSEADITKVVSATIEKPWRSRFDAAKTLNQLVALRSELNSFQVLDPACGSGNFLYIAYLQLRRLENEILQQVYDEFGKKGVKRLAQLSSVDLRQFHGIESMPFAVELAKVTLLLAKEIALRETTAKFKGAQEHLIDKALPLDNLDSSIRCADALFCKWPKVNAIIGNPPYQSKNKIVQELGRDYVDAVRSRYPDVPGRADYCVFWFRRAHDELPEGGRAGLVGTNTIRQNYSREGGLDYIVQNGGTITEAVSTQVWSGDAAVHVSIVNWKKGKESGKKRLFVQRGDSVDSPWELYELPAINSALSPGFDVTQAVRLKVNHKPGTCCQGQTHGDEAFLLSLAEAHKHFSDPSVNPVLHPFLIGDDILGSSNSAPSRYVIDLSQCGDLTEAMAYGAASERVKERVFPAWKSKAERERQTTGKETGPRQAHFKHWWKLWRARTEIMPVIATLPRYIVCVCITKHPIFEFVAPEVHPNASLQVFAFPDEYSFGILQSGIHWEWFKARGSTMNADPRYTSESVFETFVWPQNATLHQVEAVSGAALDLRRIRRQIMAKNGWNFRELYRTLDTPGYSLLRDAHEHLDAAVRRAYGMNTDDDTLQFLLGLNTQLSNMEASGKFPVGPGLPPKIDAERFISADCIRTAGYVFAKAAANL